MKEQAGSGKSVRLILPEAAGAVVENIADLLARQIESRCGAHVITGDSAEVTIELAIRPGLGAECFEIADGQNSSIRIIGGDERGLLYGVGKFLRDARYDRETFTIGEWRGTSAPDKPIRGIYFATHFYNFYQTAPIAEVERYVEELALWGANTLGLWYDMHHFKSFDDPDAAQFRDRLRSILQAAKRLGLDVCLGVIGNEAYDDSPAELRADPSAGRGGYYDIAVCPNKPGGMKYILTIVGELFDWASDLMPKYVWIWPYDQGGCGCEKCKPWGSNGFMLCADRLSDLTKNKLPGAKIILSTWFFDPDEWRSILENDAQRLDAFDVLLMELGHQPYGVPPTEDIAALKMPIVGFPEISMEGMWPWGGFGANPQPSRFSGAWQEAKDLLAGGFPYSEGLFEDINKVLWTQMYWDTTKSVYDILSEYIAYEFSPDIIADMLSVIHVLEQNHHLRWWPGELEGIKLMMDWFPSKGTEPQGDPGAEEAFVTMKHLDAVLPTRARQSWRWRILYLRALLDSELKTNGGTPDTACQEALHELNRIYFATEQTDPTVRAPAE